ncbi:hypothetical protein HFO61_30680 [Rhizobium leguminosarum]|nr:hypothetical protein [Rhizobium leguminosarum]MBY5551113.1 hypothetical protein [Rhizobium leguminosarum]
MNEIKDGIAVKVGDKEGVVVGRYTITVIAIALVLCLGMALYFGAI